MSLFEDDYNEHELAWRSKNFELIQKLADQYKTDEARSVSKVLNALNNKTGINCLEEYDPVWVDRLLCQFPDCLPSTYVSNLIVQSLGYEAHFNYMYASLPKGKRFARMPTLKEEVQEQFYTRLIMVYYKVGVDRAQQYKDLLRHKGKFDLFISNARALITDSFLTTVTKSKAEQKMLRQL